MASYARGLSVVGFILTAWAVYGLAQGIVWHPDNWRDICLSLLHILLLGVPSLLLLRTGVPGPVGGVVRRLALLWVILGICLAGWIMFAIWTIVSSSHFYAYRADLSTVLSLSILLATAVFALGSVPPLWSLSKRPR